MSKGKHFEKGIKKHNIKELMYLTLELIFITTMIVSLLYIYNWVMDNRSNKKIQEGLFDLITISKDEDTNNEIYNVNFEQLKEKNEDTVAWIKVKNTNIEYPIVKTKDNNYYLEHSFDKTENKAGWVFADYRNKIDGTDKNIVIYGHNRKDGTMFGTAKKFLSQEWYENEENRKIIFITEQENAVYQVFSVYQIEDEDYYIKTNFENDNSFKEFISTIKKRSLKDFNVNVTEQDNLLTLSTCATNNKYRTVLHAKKI